MTTAYDAPSGSVWSLRLHVFVVLDGYERYSSDDYRKAYNLMTGLTHPFARDSWMSVASKRIA